MPLLKLSGIGKIYYSEGSVAVGIRGIDLSFERGEFVAITGASGSGKSTLLNVISGMDSYEEGELYIEDTPTSHYLEPDWEEYRSKYISFIFQDYNILESYTVLQNVELALMHIKDKRERRKRAVELLTRVGMEKHLRQKGSKLSGGQKQRTVIARALAKDSPIILADEPTGNLDEATSKEIIDLLREVSKDKLLIVVTHNYEEVEHCATRHIRIFDGAVEFDRGERVTEKPVREAKEINYTPAKKKKFNFREFVGNFKDGIALGGQVFASRPKLAVFTCLLMTVGMLGIFLMTSICFDKDVIETFSFDMFEYREGRVVVVRRDGEVPTSDEISSLAEEYGAEKYIPCDYLLDYTVRLDISYIPTGYYSYSVEDRAFLHTADEFEGNFEGTLPDEDGEILLCLPISEKKIYGDVIPGETTVYCENILFTVTGITFYLDNNIAPAAYVTASDFERVSAIRTLTNYGGQSILINGVTENGTEVLTLNGFEYAISSELGDKIYFSKSYGYGSGYYRSAVLSVGEAEGCEIEINGDRIADSIPNELADYDGYHAAIIGSELLAELSRLYVNGNYSQFSLIFKNDAEASRAAEKLLENGYIAVLSNSSYEPDPFEKFGYGFLVFMMIAIWVGGVLCLALFIRLCQSRSIVSFKNDIAIMRSMGIKTTVIKISMYMRSVIALIPAALAMFAVAYFIFTSPTLNGYFTYLYPLHYGLICLGLLLIAIHVSFKQQSKLFAGSVKKTLTGGELND